MTLKNLSFSYVKNIMKILIFLSLIFFANSSFADDQRYFVNCDSNGDGQEKVYFSKKDNQSCEEGGYVHLGIKEFIGEYDYAINAIWYDVGLDLVKEHCPTLLKEINYIGNNKSGKYSHSKFYNCFNKLEQAKKNTITYKIGSIFNFIIDIITAPFHFVWGIISYLNPIDSKEERKLKIMQYCIDNASQSNTEKAYKESLYNCLKLKKYND